MRSSGGHCIDEKQSPVSVFFFLPVFSIAFVAISSDFTVSNDVFK